METERQLQFGPQEAERWLMSLIYRPGAPLSRPRGIMAPRFPGFDVNVISWYQLKRSQPCNLVCTPRAANRASIGKDLDDSPVEE